ncbi:MAG TPA: hypothetical protein VF611_06215 [Pyrinomonadaceae bacterium]
MKYHLAAPSRARLTRSLAAAALLLSASAAGAARQFAPAPASRRSPDVERIREQQRREMGLRRGGEEAGHPPDERAVKAAVKQLNEDFQRIQVIRNDVARALVAGGALDYARVSEQGAELRKRALRMQAYLALQPEPKAGEIVPDEAARASGKDELKGALVRLCKKIDSFVANPRFKSPEVLDVGANARARRDLREIISLSEGVRESADRLGRDDSSAGHVGP